MRYISVDIESSGLDPNTCQILEIAAVIDDLKNPLPLEELPKFHCYVRHDLYQGEAHALGLHSRIFKKLANPEPGDRILPPSVVMYNLDIFFLQNKMPSKIVVAGKNFGAFDLNFIKRLPDYNLPARRFKFHHRSLDPAILYMDLTDEEPPSLETILKRSGLGNEVPHTALEDALLVIKLLRNKFLTCQSSSQLIGS